MSNSNYTLKIRKEHPIQEGEAKQATSSHENPQTLNPQDWNEWVKGSGVAGEITALNVTSLVGDAVLEKLFISDKLERTNSGKISTTLLNRYSTLGNGGWWCSGVDILTDFGVDEWGQFKPYQPRTFFQKNGELGGVRKTIKYEPPPKVAPSIFALQVSLSTWEKVATRYSVELPKNIPTTPTGRALGFWKWVIENPKLEIAVTEGAKKAGSLLSQGVIAIGLGGIYSGYRQERTESGEKVGEPELIPQLKVLAAEKREFIFFFDRDTKQNAIKNNYIATHKTGKLLEKEGAKVSFTKWQEPFKGIDDLIVGQGEGIVKRLLRDRIPLAKLEITSHADISKYNPTIVNCRYLDKTVIIPDDAKLIGLQSPKGTGKTEFMSRTVQDAIFDGHRVIVITHREQLSKALAERFGLDYRTDVKKSDLRGNLGYALCIDSLHPKAHPKFDPQEWEDAIVILDEVEQVIWHALSSGTCSDNRVKIIESLTALVRTVTETNGKVFLADADLSSITLDYISKLIGEKVKTHVIQNNWKPDPGKRKVFIYGGNDPRDIINELVERVTKGQKLLVHTTGQKQRSKYGTINLETYLTEHISDDKILRIDRPSVSNPNHAAYGCMSNLNETMKNYQVVLCSPVVETGVSIDLKNHFDAVFVIAYGVQTVEAVCQSLERLRDDVERHVWAKKTAKNNRIGNGSFNIKFLLRSEHKQTEANIALLQKANMFSDDDIFEINCSPDSLIAWAKIACSINYGKTNYREEITNKLIRDGYERHHGETESPEDANFINRELSRTRDENYFEYCDQVSEVQSPTHPELEALKIKRSLTQEEQLKKRKGQLEKSYGVEVTPELVQKDDDGWYSQLTLHYYLTVGRIYLAARDNKALARMRKNGDENLFKPDINNSQKISKVRALEILNIKQFFEKGAEFTKHTLKDWLEKLIPLRYDIKHLLGVTINPKNDTPIAVAQRLLKKLGLRLVLERWEGGAKNKTRVYSACDINPDERDDIFKGWLERDLKTFGDGLHTLF